MHVDSDLSGKLARHIREDIPQPIVQGPQRWPEDVELALIDAIFSARARYGQPAQDGRPATGVQAVVSAWRDHRRGDSTSATGVANDLAALGSYDEETFLRILSNNSQLAGRTKAQVVLDAAHALATAGVHSAADLRSARDSTEGVANAKKAFLSVRGCGPTLWRYFTMQVGFSDTKPDTWILRYVRSAVSQPALSADQVATLVNSAASQLGVDASSLDHAIWRKASGRASVE
ncbi:hypothetical protein M3G03_10305 [Aestuariimicrobium sp. p3-SID1156]|uniref:hypothetical protein n=1 Tax=Aestuariimicrobium sp. p3-SID1156 TaxID=2916038 RepID=UPI00223BE231|nr:hypothetical protein [Aestuariimicrobium sp. p3-SID1156]MCT1459923.1 hypothetical protein [Aestuariimicrobium sp. p3-SID1156]